MTVLILRMKSSKSNQVLIIGLAVAAVLLLASCATTTSQTHTAIRQFAPPAPPPEPPRLLLDTPPLLAANHLPVLDPALALVYPTPLARESYTLRRLGRQNPARLMAEFQAQEWDSWKQTLASAPQQTEELMLEEVLQLTIPEGSAIPRELFKVLLMTESDLPLMLNEQVLRYVNYFLGRGQRTLRESLRRAGAYQPMISRVLAEEGVPQELIYLVQAESGFRAKARSPKAATGMWQFVSFRGKQYGLNQTRHVDERLDPEKATRAAARHLADLYASLGDWYLAMAAYNCGPLCAQRAVERTGYADYWELVKRGALPRETSNYVPAILAMALLGKNAETFGLDDIVPEQPIRYDSVPTYARINLDLVADVTGSTLARLKELNPALLGTATPDSPYTLRLPRGTGSQFEEEIGKVPEAGRASWRRHLVREGETVAQIAARYRVRPQDLTAVNQIGAEGPAAGERLNVPVPLRLPKPEPVLRAGGMHYTVRPGDTLATIARRQRVTVAQLQHWNQMTGTKLRAGQSLHVQAPLGPQPAAPVRRQVASNSSQTISHPAN